MSRNSAFWSACLGCSALLAPAEAMAQEQAQAEIPGEIVVIAERIKGQVDTPQPPVATYSEADIAALGASSITDLLARISPQTGSGRGRGDGAPVVLVNGQRIASFREMRNYPPEAVKRVEVLPEEVALRFGFPPDARVVNVILKDDFRSRRLELTYGQPDRGGMSSQQLEASLLRIAGPSRLNLNGSAQRSSALFESERSALVSTAAQPTLASDPQPADWRSLVGASRDYQMSTSWTRGLGKDGLGGSLSLNASAEQQESTGWSGLNTVLLTDPASGDSALRTLADPLRRRSATTTLAGGAGLNTVLGAWQLSATLDLTHTEGTSRVDRRADTAALVAAVAAGSLAYDGQLPGLPDAGFDKTTTNSDRIDSLVTLVGRPIDLPAGPVGLTAKAGYTWLSYDTADFRAGGTSSSLLRKRLIGGLNVALPLTSRREHVLPGLGDLTLNLSADWTHVSDFGPVNSWSAGLTWSPLESLGLQTSYVTQQQAPSVTELGAPQTITFDVPVYDYTRGETALVSLTSGGNPALRREQQRDWKFSANWQLPFLKNSSLLVEYFRNRSNDVTASFPLLTPDIEAAFPGRVVRDPSGRLIAIDQRPVTFAEQSSSRLRWGLNLSGQLGKAPPGGGPGFGGGRPDGARRGGGRGGMMAAMMGGGPIGGRWGLGIFHTAQFDNRVLIAPGGPELDLLGGDALGSSGSPRHKIEFNANLFYNWVGLFAQGTWNGPYDINGASNLRFGALGKVNLNLFADFGRQKKIFEKVPLLKGARMSLRIENLFDARQRVTDAAGAVPLAYQPDYLDPRGRVISIELRKMF
ncbi:MAG: TonB-dependent receptor [Novosphingobium sp.]|nr:TonB-dependent receptor [Novosphingobium sp.]